MRSLIILPLLGLLAAPLIATAAGAEPLSAVLHDYETMQARYDPVGAGQNGDREALSRLPDVSPAGDARQRDELERLKARLARVTSGEGEDALNRDLLARTLDDQLRSLSFDEARITPVDALGSFNGGLTQLAETTPIRDRADADAWLARLAAMPGLYTQETANLKRGIGARFTQPKPVVEVVLAVARAQAATAPDADPLLAPFRTLPASIPSAQQAELRAAALALVRDRIKPVQAAYAGFLGDEYLPHARPSLAARDLPAGEAYYAFLVRHHTTTAMTPDQIHALGEAEVTRIRAQMEAVLSQSGFTGGFAAYQAHLRTDPRFYAKSPEALLQRAALTAKIIDDHLMPLFATLPRQPFAVRPVPKDSEESQTTAYYQQGAPALGLAGAYYVNLSHIDQRPLYELPVLTAHEAEPGHHLQIALAQERTDLPRFRRDAYITAFVEGWGLYSEQLGWEMGIYRTPEEKFGALSYEMWRACRLVADTGIHWLRWSREQARACFTDNTALAAKNIEVELDRYISWPGQALAYKVGELKLMELRRRSEAALGPKFDIRRFHDAVLLEGPLPLDVLERRIDAWIAAEKARASA